ncbi:argininosuccinate lyase [Mangrovicoccus algicola]|uniref:Argininosuccinate lyase n=1 Tax=Mangrovicoccus algicola TaxID=2771008 RepID=A0A8J7D0E4_9RHOB|nr:argininosuccinate lyase [Mangrovicoccus algicola]MBE3639328.1 argininosuccinate lyase [Mangrovicoccus algicola]
MRAAGLACLAALALLAGCGADGPPIRPAPEEEDSAPAPGLTVSGTASMGVTGAR